MSEPIVQSDTPRTDREEYVTGKNDVGFKVVNPGLCLELERETVRLRAELGRVREDARLVRQTLENISNWREGAKAYDKDVGNPERGWDEDEIALIETVASDTLKVTAPLASSGAGK